MKAPALILLLALAMLVGCAGQAPQLTPISQVTDDALNCEQIRTEITANNTQVGNLASAKGWKVAQNVGIGAVGLLFPPLWFGMDFQDTAGRETTSIEQRNSMLGALARKSECDHEALRPRLRPLSRSASGTVEEPRVGAARSQRTRARGVMRSRPGHVLAATWD